MSDKNDFLEALANLIDQFGAKFTYTNDDDGIHIVLNGEEVFVGFLAFDDSAKALRSAKNIGGKK